MRCEVLPKLSRSDPAAGSARDQPLRVAASGVDARRDRGERVDPVAVAVEVQLERVERGTVADRRRGRRRRRRRACRRRTTRPRARRPARRARSSKIRGSGFDDADDRRVDDALDLDAVARPDLRDARTRAAAARPCRPSSRRCRAARRSRRARAGLRRDPGRDARPKPCDGVLAREMLVRVLAQLVGDVARGEERVDVRASSSAATPSSAVAVSRLAAPA